MKVTPLELPGVLHLQADVHPDDRGWLMEVFRAERYAAAGIHAPFVQDNHARSVKGTVRGLHWQRHHAQGKLLTVLHGTIYDVVVDVRRHAPTYGQWVGITLAAGTGDQIWVPPDYAHGFCVVSEVADVLYKCTDVYVPGEGRGVRFDDPTLAIPWPTDAPVLSAQDARLPWLADLDPTDAPGGGR